MKDRPSCNSEVVAMMFLLGGLLLMLGDEVPLFNSCINAFTVTSQKSYFFFQFMVYGLFYG